MGLKPISKPKKEFVNIAGAREVKAPQHRKGQKLSDTQVDYIKMMWFGLAGSGKTHLIGQFVRDLGMKVAIISTDIGDSGHLTIKNDLIAAGKQQLLDNVYLLSLEGWAEVSDFLRNPYKYDPGMWDFNPDILAWDGFSGFQQVDISEYIGDMQPAEKGDGSTRERSDFRESGLQFEQADWGAVRNATVRSADKFLGIGNPSGKPLHKILTCHEAVAYKPVDSNKKHGPQQVVESYKPLLQGSGGTMILGGFDLIMRTKVKTRITDNDGAKREYFLITAGTENLVAKNRGFDLEPTIPASAIYLWERVQKGLGINVGQ